MKSFEMVLMPRQYGRQSINVLTKHKLYLYVERLFCETLNFYNDMNNIHTYLY